MKVSPKARKGAFFAIGATIICAAHAQLMAGTALAVSYWSMNHVSDGFNAILTLSMLCALVGSITLSASGWWCSVYRGQSTALVATIATGIAAYSIIEKIRVFEFSTVWTGLPLIAIVLAAGALSASALRRG